VTDSLKHARELLYTGKHVDAREAERMGLVNRVLADEDALEAAVEARDAVDPSVPVFVGSGVTEATVADAVSTADGVIVGTALKEGGETAAPVDRDRVERLVAAARE
jgi:predicted TIM-barrel enzyme